MPKHQTSLKELLRHALAKFSKQRSQKNMETVARWIKYFEQYKNNFEILPARDNAIGSTQALYKRFTNLSFVMAEWFLILARLMLKVRRS